MKDVEKRGMKEGTEEWQSVRKKEKEELERAHCKTDFEAARIKMEREEIKNKCFDK